METKLFNINSCSFCDSPNKTALVLFYKDCNLRCKYCHNHNLIQGVQEANFSKKEVLDVIKSQKKKGVNGEFLKNEWLIFSGGEPLLMPLEVLKEITEEAKKQGMKVGMWTNLLMLREKKDYICSNFDFINVDLKTNFANYKKFHPLFNESEFITNLFYLRDNVQTLQFSTVINSFYVTQENLDTLAEFIREHFPNKLWRIVTPRGDVLDPERGLSTFTVDSDYLSGCKFSIIGD